MQYTTVFNEETKQFETRSYCFNSHNISLVFDTYDEALKVANKKNKDLRFYAMFNLNDDFDKRMQEYRDGAKNVRTY